MAGSVSRYIHTHVCINSKIWSCVGKGKMKMKTYRLLPHSKHKIVMIELVPNFTSGNVQILIYTHLPIPTYIQCGGM